MIVRIMIILSVLVSMATLGSEDKGVGEVAVIETNYGDMKIEFHYQETPKTIKHFKYLAKKGFYDGEMFYRVVKDYVIQGGSQEASDEPEVEDELVGDHKKGAIAFARDRDPTTGTTEIFICLEDKPEFNGDFPVFGHIVEGLDVMEKIGNVEVNEKYIEIRGHKISFHSPVEPVVIKSIKILPADVL